MHPQLMKLIEDEEDNKGKTTLEIYFILFPIKQRFPLPLVFDCIIILTFLVVNFSFLQLRQLVFKSSIPILEFRRVIFVFL